MPDTSQQEPFTFPAVARLELDELLEQLIERANDVLGTQGRLRGLLRATQSIATELDLPSLLQRIVDEARELIGADYAALGVVGEDLTLTQFVHSGMDPVTVERIGHLPSGRGILGQLIIGSSVRCDCVRSRITPGLSGSRPITHRCGASSVSRSASVTRCSGTST